MNKLNQKKFGKEAQAGATPSAEYVEERQPIIDPNLVTMVVLGAQGDKEEDVPVEEVCQSFNEKLKEHRATTQKAKLNVKLEYRRFLFKESSDERQEGLYENPYVNAMIEVLESEEPQMRRHHLRLIRIVRELLEAEKKSSRPLLIANFSVNKVPIFIFKLFSCSDPALRDEAVTLGCMVFEGGNRAAQDTITKHIQNDIRSGERVLTSLHTYLCDAIRSLEFRKQVKRITGVKDTLGAPFAEASPLALSCAEEMKWDDAFTKNMLKLLQLFNMGHHEVMQAFMRVQPAQGADKAALEKIGLNTAGELDIVIVNIVEDLVEYVLCFDHHVNAENVELVMQAIETLRSMVEGPCKANQKLVIQSEVVSFCLRMMDDPPDELESDVILDFNLVVVKLLTALLEGMGDDKSAGMTIAYSLNWANVRSNLGKLFHDVQQTENPMLKAQSQALGAQYALLIYSLEDNKCLLKPIRETLEDAVVDYAFFSKDIVCVEIVQNKAIERVYFQIPYEATFFTQRARKELLWEFDRLPSRRIPDFFDTVMKKREEMRHRAIINDPESSMGRTFSYFYPYYDYVKYAQLFLNLFICFVMLSNGWSDVPVESVDKDVLATPELEAASSLVVVLLGTILLFTSGAQVAMYTIIHLPLIWIAKFAENNLNLSIERVTTFDKKTRQRITSLRLILRKHGKIRTKDAGFYLTLVYYTFRDVMFLWYVLYVIVCQIAYVNYFYYTVLLIDIITWVKAIRMAIAAMYRRLFRLAVLMMLYIFVLLIFAAYAYYYYRDDIRAESGTPVCNLFWNCFFVVLHKSLLKQGTDYVGGDYDINVDDNQERILLSTVFYLIFGVLFLSMLIGEIVTGYAEMSQELREKTHHMNTECFICELPRTRFNWDHAAFANHVKHEHNMWNYLYLMLHVGNKRDMELSGQEAYVRRCIRSANTGFFPYMQSLALAEGEKLHGTGGGHHGGHGGGGGASADISDSALELELAVKRQNTLLENVKTSVENRGDMCIGISRSVEMELRTLSNTIREELTRLKEELDMSATTDSQRIERQLQEMQDTVTNRLDRVVVVVGRATRGATGGDLDV